MSPKLKHSWTMISVNISVKISVEQFLDNKLSIHFGEDKTKSILFGTKRILRKVGKLNITYQGINRY